VAADTIRVLGTVLFAMAVLHTFSIKIFQHLALKFPSGSVRRTRFTLLGRSRSFLDSGPAS
jgi:hypothetical protein